MGSHRGRTAAQHRFGCKVIADARERIASLKTQRLEVEAEIASLEEAPKIISLHPATLDRYAETVESLAASLADHAEAQDDQGPPANSFRELAYSGSKLLAPLRNSLWQRTVDAGHSAYR
jgi:hypothetical protein